jgi:hypothetical protein
MQMKLLTAAAMLAAVGLGTLVSCGEAPSAHMGPDGNGVSLRNLADTPVAIDKDEQPRRLVQGTLVPTPSDTKSRHYLLRERKALNGTIIAVLREERGEKVAYSRVEVDCQRRLFHVLGVGSSRAKVEVTRAYDGPLRSIEGLPLRQELAAFVCERSKTPLAPAPAARS